MCCVLFGKNGGYIEVVFSEWVFWVDISGGVLMYFIYGLINVGNEVGLYVYIEVWSYVYTEVGSYASTDVGLNIW